MFVPPVHCCRLPPVAHPGVCLAEAVLIQELSCAGIHLGLDRTGLTLEVCVVQSWQQRLEVD